VESCVLNVTWGLCRPSQVCKSRLGVCSSTKSCPSHAILLKGPGRLQAVHTSCNQLLGQNEYQRMQADHIEGC
ncbi:hypothetical protein JMJ77_0013657, partial [Colletotrichum scovillei]